MLKYLLTALLFAQDAPRSDNDYFQWQMDHLAALEQLEQDKLRSQPSRPKTLMVTVVAQYGDGTPARGEIACDGTWCKFDEDEYCDTNLPFKTDSRGACIFNPSASWLSNQSDDDEWSMTCRAYAGNRFGMLTFTPSDGRVYTITVPGISPTDKK